MSKEISGQFQIVNEKNQVVLMRALKKGQYDRLLRLLELIADEEALSTLDKVIEGLEAPKREVASKIAETISRAKNLREVLTEALIVFPKAELDAMSLRLGRIRIVRKPGTADCLVLEADEKSWTIPL